jgi:hypothetical protein
MPDDQTVIPVPSGPKHELVLAAMHRILRPRTYLEIGVDRGDTLRSARCPSIGIDPAFTIDQSVIGEKPECLLYRMTSDAFFERHDPAALLGRKIDFAFIDGMHQFEFLLRDFINVERCCHPGAVIALHDCVPADLYLARRVRSDESLRRTSQLQGGWCGDVWKALPILRRYRPDLRIETFDSAWTGLILISNLDPSSNVLNEAYMEALAAFFPVDLRDYGVGRHARELRMQDARILLDPATMPRHFAF